MEQASRDGRIPIGYSCSFVPEALLAERGYDPVLGARPLRRALQREIEDVLSEKILFGEVTSGQIVRVDANELRCDGGKLLPYPTTIGVIRLDTFTVQHWTPAAYKPRGYKAAALRVLEAVAAMPGLVTTRPEATYLAWIDCREMMAARGVDDPAAFFEAAGVGLSDGAAFGAPGFVRLNFGCPRATLDEALARMARALGA